VIFKKIQPKNRVFFEKIRGKVTSGNGGEGNCPTALSIRPFGPFAERNDLMHRHSAVRHHPASGFRAAFFAKPASRGEPSTYGLG